MASSTPLTVTFDDKEDVRVLIASQPWREFTYTATGVAVFNAITTLQEALEASDGEAAEDTSK